MKTTIFTCLRSSTDCLGRQLFVRAKLTIDVNQPEYVDLHIFKRSEHHSCNHEPTAVSKRQYLDTLAHLFRWADASSGAGRGRGR